MTPYAKRPPPFRRPNSAEFAEMLGLAWLNSSNAVKWLWPLLVCNFELQRVMPSTGILEDIEVAGICWASMISLANATRCTGHRCLWPRPKEHHFWAIQGE